MIDQSEEFEEKISSPLEINGLIYIPTCVIDNHYSLPIRFLKFFKLLKYILQNIESFKFKFLVSISILDGRHGYSKEIKVHQNMMEAKTVTGMFQGLQYEFGDKLIIKSIDFDKIYEASFILNKIIDELNRDSKGVEIGFLDDRRIAIRVSKKEYYEKEPRVVIDKDSVILFTGDESRIILEIAKQFAKIFKPHIVIVGLVPINNDIEAALNKIRKLGVEVDYYDADLTSKDRLQFIFEDIITKFNSIDGVVYETNIFKDSPFNSISEEMWKKAYEIKGLSCLNLLELFDLYSMISNDNLKRKFFTLFSSVYALYGGLNQVNYISANKALVGLLYDFSQKWDSKIALKAYYLPQIEKSEHQYIDVEELGKFQINELLYGGDEIDVAWHGKIEEYDKYMESTNELLYSFKKAIKCKALFPMIDDIIELESGKKIVCTKLLDPSIDLYLKDYIIDNCPVFPLSYAVEASAQIGKLIFPNLILSKLTDVNLKKWLRIPYPTEIIITGEIDEINSKLNVKIESSSKRVTHFSATLHYKDSLETNFKRIDIGEIPYISVNMTEIYNLGRYFHGPTFQVLSEVKNLSADKIITSHNVIEGKHFSFSEKVEFSFPYIILEALIQTCGFLNMYTDRFITSPIFFEEIIICNPDIKIGPIANIKYKAEKISKEGNITEFVGEAFDEHNNPIILISSCKMIPFKPLSKEAILSLPLSFNIVNRINGLKEIFGKSIKSKISKIPLNEAKFTYIAEASIFKNEKNSDLNLYYQFLSDDEKLEINEIKNENYKWQKVAGRLVTKIAFLSYLYSFNEIYRDIPLDEIKIKNSEKGVPKVYVPEYLEPYCKDIHISISHIEDMVISAVNNNILGIDLVKLTDFEIKNQSFTKKVYTKGELKLIEELVNVKKIKNKYEGFALLWCAKESFVKALGKGFNLIGYKEIEITSLYDTNYLKIECHSKELNEQFSSLIKDLKTYILKREENYIVIITC